MEASSSSLGCLPILSNMVVVVASLVRWRWVGVTLVDWRGPVTSSFYAKISRKNDGHSNSRSYCLLLITLVP